MELRVSFCLDDFYSQPNLSVAGPIDEDVDMDDAGDAPVDDDVDVDDDHDPGTNHWL